MAEGGEWEALHPRSSNGGVVVPHNTCSCRWCWRRPGAPAAGVVGVVIVVVAVLGHLQLQVVLASSRGTCSCRCCWCRRRHCHPWTPAAAGVVGVGVGIVRGHLQLQAGVVRRGGGGGDAAVMVVDRGGWW